MSQAVNPIVTDPLPSFVTAPGDTDVLMAVMAVFSAVAVLSFGLLFLRLHTLPERLAHKSQKIQFEIVAVLGLISLFTHMHIFWIIGLLLALIDLPDLGGMLRRIAVSVEKIAGIKPPAAGAVHLERAHGVEPHGVLAPAQEEASLQPSMRHLAEEIDHA